MLSPSVQTRKLHVKIDIDRDLEPLDNYDHQRVLKENVEFVVNGQRWYVLAVRVERTPHGAVFAFGPYNAKVEALCELAQTSAPRTLQDKEGRQWLLMLSPFEKED